MSERERDALDKAARDEETSVNWIVRTAIRDWLRTHGYLTPRTPNSA